MSDKIVSDFRGLEAWRQCKEIRRKIWELAQSFPKEEKFRLSDQIIRASRSATACIAEGHGRFHFQENIQFCRQARGSLYELIDHLDTAQECGYLEENQTRIFIHDVEKAIRITNGYIRYLKNRKENLKTHNS